MMKSPEGWIYNLNQYLFPNMGLETAYVVDGPVIKILGWDDLLDDLLLNLLAQLLS